MSLKFVESFDGGNYAKRMATGLAGNVGSTYGKNGDGAHIGDNVSGYFYIPIKGGGGVRHIIGMHMFWVATGGGQIMMFNGDRNCMGVDGANRRLFFRYQTGSVSASELYTPAGSFDPNTWHYVELDFVYSQSNASFFNIWIDGSLELESATNIDVYPSGTPSYCLVGGTSPEEIDSMYVDDVYYVDPTDDIYPTEPLGPVDMGVLLPSGNGNSSDLVGSDTNSVDNYQQVDENPPNDGTDYNGSGTDGDKDTYAIDDMSGDPDVVAMMLSLNAVKTDVGVKYIKPVVRTKTGVDYTTTPTMTASSTYSTYTAAKAWRTATDYWVSATSPSTEWWKADFGSAKDMGHVICDIGVAGNTYPREAELQYSDNDSDWFAAGNKVIGITNISTIRLNADLTDTSHRYWRIVFTDFSGTNGMELDAVYFYEVSATLGDDAGDSIALAETYDVYDVFYMTNPGTGKRLNQTDLNAMEIGVQVSDT